MTHRVEVDLGGKVLWMETGKIARQADGAVLIGLGETVALVCAVGNKGSGPDRGFFPLTIDYREKAYAAGKIPGGFLKREGRMGDKETLSARMIDRPLRPLFDDGYMAETGVYINILSSDKENDADVLGLTGAAASLLISDIPMSTPIAGVRIGRINGEFILNPSFAELEFSELDVVVAGSRDSIVMVEGGCKEVSESSLLEGLQFAHGWIQKIIEGQEELRKLAGKPKRTVEAPVIDEALAKAVTKRCEKSAGDILFMDGDKLERQMAWSNFKDTTKQELAEEFPDGESDVSKVIGKNEKSIVRGRILKDRKRIDGRGPEDIRPISCETELLPRTHGSALFTRGETQALVVATLGTRQDQKIMDELDGDYKKTYMLHYNFPAWSVGEVRPNRGPGRRGIGHGHLAERALLPVLPAEEEFPYTIRLVSEITESNGSSSMASVCGGTMALLDTGVPIKAPVAGIAMGLVTEGDSYVVLSDILGAEDHLGDMDFKVTGSEAGITAFQMDSKLGGITFQILEEALEQARKGRLHILGEMAKCIEAPREQLSAFAPKIVAIYVPKDKIRDVIGPGGKMIRRISEESGAKIDVEDDGRVTIAAVNRAGGDRALEMIRNLTEDPEVGRTYQGTVTSIMPFGAFVEILPGREGLCHISELEDFRVDTVEDVVQEGEVIPVQVKGIDGQGKISLSRRMAMAEAAAE